MLFVSRLVFTRTAETLLHHPTVQVDDGRDHVLAENQSQLRHQPQDHFGIEPPVCLTWYLVVC